MSGLFDQITNYSPPLLTAGQVNYKGTWDATANSPTLTSPPASTSKGDYYVVSTAGTQFSISFAVGDWIISNGTAWEKVDLTDAVSSVFGRTGAVVGVSTDYSAVGITNTAIGASSPSTGAFTTITATSTITATGAVTGSNLSGTNTGNQTISITGDVTAAGSTGVLTASVTKINGTSLAGLTTGILKNTTTTGVPSIAVAADFPTLNQNTTGSAATLTTPRAIYGNNFDGSAALTQAITGTYGGTGVNNGANTITIAGNVTHAGAFTQSFTATANTALTLPTTGTLATLAGSEALSNKTITASAFNGTVGATTASTGAFTTLSATGNVTISGVTNQRLFLNTNSASAPNRVAFQESTTNGSLALFGLPNGTSNTSTIGVADDSAYTNGIRVRLAVSGGTAYLISDAFGTGTAVPLVIQAQGVGVGIFSSTGLAVTGALSATGVASFLGLKAQKATATSGFISAIDEGANVYNVLGSRNNADSAYLPMVIRGTTVTLGATSDIATITSTGLAVTGTLSASGTISTSGNTTNNWGAGGTGSGQVSLNLNGGSAAGGGPLITGSNNSVSKWIIGSSGAIFGDTSTHLLLRSNSNNVYVQSAGATIGIFSSTGLAVTGTLTTSSTTLHTSSVSLTNGAAAALGTLTNAPVAGNPTKWIPIVDNGVTRYIPCW